MKSSGGVFAILGIFATNLINTLPITLLAYTRETVPSTVHVTPGTVRLPNYKESSFCITQESVWLGIYSDRDVAWYGLVRGALTRHRRFLVVASQSGFMPTQTTMPPTGIGGRNHAKITTYHCTIFVLSNSLGHNLSIGTVIFAWQALFNL